MSVTKALRNAVTGNGPSVLTVSSRTGPEASRPPGSGTLTLNDANPLLQAHKERRRTDQLREANGWPLRPEAKSRPVLTSAAARVAVDCPWMSADVRRWPWRLSLTSSLSRRAGADGR